MCLSFVLSNGVTEGGHANNQQCKEEENNDLQIRLSVDQDG